MKRFQKTIVTLALGFVMCLALLPFTFATNASAEEAVECVHTTEAMQVIEGVAATHTTNGNQEYYHCETCDKYFYDEGELVEVTPEEMVITAQGHIRAEKVAAVPATHTANGNIEYYYCADCNANFTDRSPEADEIPAGEEVMLAQGHVRAEKVAAVPVTHTANGNIEYYYCADCNANFTDRSPEADKIPEGEEVMLSSGHIRAEKVEAKAATHTENGNIEYWYCADCNANFTGRVAEAELIPAGEEVILAQGHVRAELVAAVPATHTENGNIEYYYCVTCNANFTDRSPEADEIPAGEEVMLAQGHIRAEKVAAVPATHTENGNIEYYYCAECNANFTDRSPEADEIPEGEEVMLAQGHVRAEKVEAVAATHTENGNIEYWYCADCDKYFEGRAAEAEEIPAEAIVILAQGHIRAEKVEGTPATHTTNGVREYYYCADCDAKFEGRAPEAAELTDEELVLLAQGHVRAEKIEAKAATHTENGSIECYYCADCDKYFTDRSPEAEEIPEAERVFLASGHIRAEKVAAVEPTCTTAGNVEYYYCADCDKNFEGRAPEAKEIVNVALAMKAHALKEVAEVAATTEAEGMKAHWYCEACQSYFADAEGKNSVTKDSLVIAKVEGGVLGGLFTSCFSSTGSVSFVVIVAMIAGVYFVTMKRKCNE